VKADLSDWPEDLLPDVVAILGWPWLGMSSPRKSWGLHQQRWGKIQRKNEGIWPTKNGWLVGNFGWSWM